MGHYSGTGGTFRRNAQLNPEEWKLIDALASGQPEALSCLYERYRSLLETQALRVTGDPDRAEEVTQTHPFT